MQADKVLHRLKDLTRPTGEEDLLRVEYPSARRWQITPRQGIAVACAMLAILAVWWLWPRPQAPDVAPELLAGSSEVSALAPTSGAVPESPGEIVVAVVGAVENPGLVHLPAQARVSEALAQAVPKQEADTWALNIARRLQDGEQIYVPVQGEAGAGPPGAAGEPGAAVEAGKISLSRASLEELMTLNGVGQVTAQAIVDYRETHGGFSDVSQLQEVRGIGPAKYAAIKENVVP
ncbi:MULTISPECIES: ComEA family DNA-binding protein [unclassified Corynebacterium]|uniref:ComEA family DNA-binding protein n=1 Tax=unclassified Corynebacterium TaxID=2624378 RepID=UPI0029C9F49D|nr:MULTISPECIES: ComEA family DNA-binding protein [unclassified Corynebacterium]WPF65588.1 ComEA family DNA-binding protein [Corynebacterium sp. 22KM0430]WPF68083.1 ComEA family DNA-binding protein [Corynebacterium sp. 21KM1197]